MRIALLTQFFPPVVGGEERHVYNLSAGLAAAGHDVHVMTLRLADTDVAREVNEHGVTVHRLDHIGPKITWAFEYSARPLALPVPDPVTVRHLGRLLRELRPDVVHAHNWIVNSALHCARAAGAALVLTLHDYSHVCATKRLMYRDALCSGPSLRKCLPCTSGHYDVVRGPVIYAALRAGVRRRQRRIDRFVSVSDFVRDHNELAAVRDKSDVVANFVPDELLETPALPRDPELPDEPYLFYAGDLSRQKGVHTLIAAHALLADAPPLLLVGRASDGLPEVLPDGVHVGSEWTHERVVSAFQHCLAAVLPSEWPDPCPTTVLEAMALGAALITTRMGGISSLVEPGISALTVPPGDASALAGAIGRLAGDPGRREELRRAGRLRVRRFTRSAVVAQLGELYRDAVAGVARATGETSAKPR